VSTVSAALEAARSEVSELSAALDAEKRRAEEATRAAARAEEQMRAAASSASALRDQLKEVGRLLEPNGNLFCHWFLLSTADRECLSQLATNRTCSATHACGCQAGGPVRS